jgi:Fe-S cluster assembly protein SufD
VNISAELPSRRDEAWKYSDLRATLRGEQHVLRDGRDIIERLAPGTQAWPITAGEHRVYVERMDDERHLDARSFDWDLGAGASLTRIVLQVGAAPALSTARIRLGAGAVFRQFVFAEGAKLARVETHVDVAGEDAEVALNGVYLCDSGRHADLTSIVNHRAPRGRTEQLIKGVVRKGGRGVFQGKIVVERAAQKTDARQHHNGMLLDDGAEIFAKPELMIFADDVACAHGNTAGGLDEAALFYLRSRGLTETQARALLTEAFLLEALPAWLPQAGREEIETRIGVWLGGRA